MLFTDFDCTNICISCKCISISIVLLPSTEWGLFEQRRFQVLVYGIGSTTIGNPAHMYPQLWWKQETTVCQFVIGQDRHLHCCGHCDWLIIYSSLFNLSTNLPIVHVCFYIYYIILRSVCSLYLFDFFSNYRLFRRQFLCVDGTKQ